ncbi:MAG: hypothetical protein QW416_01910 [Candidatus Nitrosocaldaceae archaeon]
MGSNPIPTLSLNDRIYCNFIFRDNIDFDGDEYNSSLKKRM